jgi:hypothetical protein
MKPPSKRTSHCNKKPFSTLLAAQIGLKRTVSQQKKRGDPIVTGMFAYKCLYCPNFHIGRSKMKGIDWKAVEAHDAKIKARAAEAVKPPIPSSSARDERSTGA